MSAILTLKPEDAKRLHTVALKWFDWQSAAIDQQLTLDGLTIDDVETFLSNDEKDELGRYKNEIQLALRECINPDTVYPNSLPDGGLGPVFLMMQLKTFVCMEYIKALLRKVYERKAATKPKTVKKQDEVERRTRTFKALNPPIALAKKYLNRPGEYERFEMSVSGAVDAYLEAGEFHIYQEKASEYLRCLQTVDDRRQEEARKHRAESAADAYNRRLNEEIRSLTTQLYRRDKDLTSYFQAMTKDNRYSGDNFDYILSEQKERDLDFILVSVANRQLERLCSEELCQFIVLPSKYYRRYYPLPSASYSFDEVPSLDFSFEIFAAAYAEIFLKQGKKTFDGFEFSLPSIEEKDNSSLLKNTKFLGYYYSIIRPEDLKGHVFWKRIPLILLKGLLNGEIRPEGTVILAASDEGVTYRIPKLKDEITIPNSFADYLRMVSTIDQMISMNILTKKIANIVKSELIELAQTCEVSSSKESVKRQDTKKARMCQLFDRGKRPSDPEVKAFGIKPNTVYRYYQDWKKTRNHT